MIKTIAAIVVLLIAATLVYAATRADTFHVARTVNIKASPEKIYPLINDFHRWEAWTPYNKDPAMKKTFSGDATTVTWAMNGTQNYMTKIMGLFFSMDQMVGKDFEIGLANLKSIAEN